MLFICINLISFVQGFTKSKKPSIAVTMETKIAEIRNDFFVPPKGKIALSLRRLKGEPIIIAALYIDEVFRSR